MGLSCCLSLADQGTTFLQKTKVWLRNDIAVARSGFSTWGTVEATREGEEAMIEGLGWDYVWLGRSMAGDVRGALWVGWWVTGEYGQASCEV